jgi:hypothetical protein
MKAAVETYSSNTILFSYIYIFGTIYASKWIPYRFIAFNLLLGLMIFIMQGIPDSLVQLIFRGVELSSEKQASIYLVLSCIYLSWILPGMYRALSGTYPKNDFLRDTIEIHIGRPPEGYDEGFKWWNKD